MEQENGTVVQLDGSISEKQGCLFQGWHADPRTKKQQVTEGTLNGDVIVYAKWLDVGTLPEKHYDHSLTGEYAGYRECHILPDWLLIYRSKKDLLILD